MPVRIESLRVNRGGPLKEDFSLDPADLNLIYGPNESGKTYLVEALIGFLFKSGKRSGWELRDWSPSGRAVLSGVDPEPVTFTRSKSKLDALWMVPSGMPPDLSRMMVVRAGDTRLSEGAGGVDTSVLKTFLSGGPTLDRVEKCVKGLHNATVENGEILTSKNVSRKRDDLQEELAVLDGLHSNLDDDLDRGAIRSVEKRKRHIETEHDALDLARRHRAFRLGEELEELSRRERTLPGEREMSEAEHDSRSRAEKLGEFERYTDELSGLRTVAEESRWIRHAGEVYSAAASRQEKNRGRTLFLTITIALLAATLTTGLLNLQVPLIISAVGSVAAMLIYHRAYARTDEDLADTRELAGIREDFRKRYGRPLTSVADLNSMSEELRDRAVRVDQIQRQAEDLEGGIAVLDSRMSSFFMQFGLENRPPSEWSDALAGLRDSKQDIDSRKATIELELARLGVDPDRTVSEPPSVQWDPDRYGILSGEIQELDGELGEMVGRENSLKSVLANRTGLDITDSWDDLRTALQDRRDRTAEQYRSVTADMLSKICVMEAVRNLRKQELERLQDGLSSQALTEPLREITGEYTGLSIGDEGELLLTTDDGESFPLDQMSTGAMEQVHLALRTSFAGSVADDTAFLILDDAFQHSDWRRRERMVDYTVNLVNKGWQVFYFTMDDHMRDLFVDAGKALGDRFAKVDIG